jgi:hypothetical protein
VSDRSGASAGRSKEHTASSVSPVVDGALVANGHAASALVVERDAQPDQLEQPGRKRSGRPKGRVECAESLGDLSQPADNGRDAEVDPITLP